MNRWPTVFRALAGLAIGAFALTGCGLAGGRPSLVPPSSGPVSAAGGAADTVARAVRDQPGVDRVETAILSAHPPNYTVTVHTGSTQVLPEVMATAVATVRRIGVGLPTLTITADLTDGRQPVTRSLVWTGLADQEISVPTTGQLKSATALLDAEPTDQVPKATVRVETGHLDLRLVPLQDTPAAVARLFSARRPSWRPDKATGAMVFLVGEGHFMLGDSYYRPGTSASVGGGLSPSAIATWQKKAAAMSSSRLFWESSAWILDLSFTPRGDPSSTDVVAVGRGWIDALVAVEQPFGITAALDRRSSSMYSNSCPVTVDAISSQWYAYYLTRYPTYPGAEQARKCR